jgi:hypothetical protein
MLAYHLPYLACVTEQKIKLVRNAIKIKGQIWDYYYYLN